MIFGLQNIVYFMFIAVIISFTAFDIKKEGKHRFLYHVGLLIICFYWMTFVYIGLKNEFSTDLFVKFILGFVLMFFMLLEQATINSKRKIIYRTFWFIAGFLMMLFSPL